MARLLKANRTTDWNTSSRNRWWSHCLLERDGPRELTCNTQATHAPITNIWSLGVCADWTEFQMFPWSSNVVCWHVPAWMLLWFVPVRWCLALFPSARRISERAVAFDKSPSNVPQYLYSSLESGILWSTSHALHLDSSCIFILICWPLTLESDVARSGFQTLLRVPNLL